MSEPKISTGTNIHITYRVNWEYNDEYYYRQEGNGEVCAIFANYNVAKTFIIKNNHRVWKQGIKEYFYDLEEAEKLYNSWCKVEDIDSSFNDFIEGKSDLSEIQVNRVLSEAFGTILPPFYHVSEETFITKSREDGLFFVSVTDGEHTRTIKSIDNDQIEILKGSEPCEYCGYHNPLSFWRCKCCHKETDRVKS